MNDSPRSRRRSNSASQNSPFQFRATNFVKKVGALTSKLGAKRSRETVVQETNPYRQTQSMDILRKPFMSQPTLSLSLPRNSDRSPSPGGSSSNGKETPGDLGKLSMSNEEPSVDAVLSSKYIAEITKESYTIPLFAWEHRPADVGEADGQPSRAGDMITEGKQNGLSVPSPQPTGQPGSILASTSGGSPNSSCKHSASSPSLSNLLKSPQQRDAAGETPRPSPSTSGDTKMAMACSSSSLSHPPLPVLSTVVTLNAEAVRQSHMKSVASKRPIPPRLASLPPLTTVHLVETADHRLRLSPSVIVRHPQHPILNLPALPPPTPVSETPRTPRPRLNTMPTLPLQGQDDQDDDPDHENGDLLDEDDEDGDDYEDAPEERGAASGFASEDDDTLEDGVISTSESSNHAQLPSRSSGRNTNVSAQPNQYVPNSSIASILALLDHTAAGNSTIASSGSHTDPEAAGRSSVSSSGSARSGVEPKERSSESEDVATPKAHRRDYFTAQVDNREGFPSPTTPIARTGLVSIQSTSLHPTRKQIGEAGPSSSPKGIASNRRVPATPAAGSRPSTLYTADSPRPGLYHQASKSMVDLFSTHRKELDHGPIDLNNRGSRVYGSGIVDAKGKGKETEPSLLRSGEHVPRTADTNNYHGYTNSEGAGIAQGHEHGSSQQDESVAVEPVSVIRRRSSMPTFTSSGPPPPYPSFLPDHHLRRFMPAPRDEEGQEQLPTYSNDIKLVAIMPRKMEFSAPGVHAKDRKWRRVQCVLEGTVFKVYRCPTKVAGVGVIGGWWEKKVGVGDVALIGGASGGSTANESSRSSSARRTPVKWEKEQEQRGSSPVVIPPSDSGEQERVSPSPRSKRHLAATFLHPNRSRVSMDGFSRSHSRAGSASPSPAASPIATPRSSLQLPRPSSDSSATASGYASSSNIAASSSTCVGSQPSQTHSRSRSHFRTHSRSSSVTAAPPSDPSRKDLIREYSLQNAESGLASDYFKRKNVIRVRMEGEQFLLQATDIAGVIEWIEGLQAATNIALDLDERPMPKGPIFPRRRRRRRPRVNADDPQIGVQITDPS